jgi:hypothetical protein
MQNSSSRTRKHFRLYSTTELAISNSIYEILEEQHCENGLKNMQIQNIRQPTGKCGHMLNTRYFLLLSSLCSDFQVPVTIATNASKVWQQGKNGIRSAWHGK